MRSDRVGSLVFVGGLLVLLLAVAFVSLNLAMAQGPRSLTRITTASHPGRSSFAHGLSADGTIIAIVGDSDFLGQGISNFQVWLYDTRTMRYTRVTTASGGSPWGCCSSLSADGTVVSFASSADFLNQGNPLGQDEVWLYDTTTMQYARVTTGTPAGRSSFNTSLSGDGTVVVFVSEADFLGQGVPAGHEEIWLYDTKTMQYTRVTSVTETSTRSHGWDPNLNADGTVVAFSSSYDLLSEGKGNEEEIWLYHRTTMTYTRVTSATDPNRGSRSPDLNADGTVVGFQSNSDLLGQGMPDTQTEVWLYDTGTMQYTRVTTASPGERHSWEPSLNADGTIVSFHGDSDFLNQGIVAGQYEAWLCDTGTMQYTRVTSATYDYRKVIGTRLSADGGRVALHSDADYLNQGIEAGQYEVWLYRGYDTYLPALLKEIQ